MRRSWWRWTAIMLAMLVFCALPVRAWDDVWGIRDNGSFEAGGYGGWYLEGLTTGDSIPVWVAGPGVSEAYPLAFEVEPSHGYYALVASWSFPSVSQYLALVSYLDIPEGVPGSWRPGIAFEFRAVSQASGAPNSVGADDAPAAAVLDVGVFDASELGQAIQDESPDYALREVVYTTTVGAGIDTGNVTAVVDLSLLAGSVGAVVINMSSSGNTSSYELWGQIDNVRLVQIPERERSDVSVIVYGGWGGIPVDAWAGAVPQERQYTAVNAFGEQQAMWSFWVDPDNDWQVTTQPTLPAGLDPDKWEYLLIRTESPTMGWTNESPRTGTLDILPGEQYIITYQLYCTG